MTDRRRDKKRVVIIGGGFAGCTAGYMLKNKGFDVTLVEGSMMLGGGCRTYFYHGHPYTYGPRHLLINVNDMHIWDYFSKFLTLRRLNHHCLTYVSDDNRFYSYPIHLDEINDMPDSIEIHNELNSRGDVTQAQNFESYWIDSVGKTLYDKFISEYSKKMWAIKNNKMIDEFSFSPKGVALKTGSKECFEGEKIIAYPEEMDGYNSYFDKCVEGCNIIMGKYVESFDINKRRIMVDGQWIEGDILISTTSIDILFDYQYGELKYIGRDFIKLILPVERITPEPYYFIYYAGDEPYTRVVEYKLLTGYKSNDTLIVIESPSFKNKLYPYPVKSEIERAKKYLSELPDRVYSIGRMGKYHYDNMDVIVKDCLELMKKI